MRYSEIVMDHFMNPRNSGQMHNADSVGIIDSQECGDMIRVWIEVQDDRLLTVTHEVFGCPAAVASCSMMTELATGRTLEQALELTDNDVANALGGLPEPKYHCSNLAASALHKAIENFRTATDNIDNPLKITALVNNQMPAPLLSEHGLSFWIEYAGKNILFDTGQTDAIIKNADLLDIDLSKTNAIVLSHGHYDHTGGLKAVLGMAPDAIIYMHPDAPKVRYSCRPGKSAKNVSMPSDVCHAVALAGQKGNLIYTSKPQSIGPQMMLTGQIPRMTEFEDSPTPFYLDEQTRTPDWINDDQALLVSTPKGLIVILGCTHAGLINTLKYATTLIEQPICTIIGGMHLRSASPERLSKTLQALEKYNIQRLIPCHCTGNNATKALQDQFGNTVMSEFNINIEV